MHTSMFTLTKPLFNHVYEVSTFQSGFLLKYSNEKVNCGLPMRYWNKGLSAMAEGEEIREVKMSCNKMRRCCGSTVGITTLERRLDQFTLLRWIMLNESIYQLRPEWLTHNLSSITGALIATVSRHLKKHNTWCILGWIVLNGITKIC